MLLPVKHLRPCRGFTLVELMVGVVVTSIVLSALTVFTFGVSAHWAQSDSGQSVFLAGTMAVDRLNQILRSARMIDPNASSTQCMVWVGDYNGDNKIQFGEQALLCYDAAHQQLLEYTAPSTDAITNAPSSTLTNAATFAAAQNVSSTILARNVQSCEFVSIAGSSSVRPSLEIIMTLASGATAPITTTTVYTTVALRTPGVAQ